METPLLDIWISLLTDIKPNLINLENNLKKWAKKSALTIAHESDKIKTKPRNRNVYSSTEYIYICETPEIEIYRFSQNDLHIDTYALAIKPTYKISRKIIPPNLNTLADAYQPEAHLIQKTDTVKNITNKGAIDQQTRNNANTESLDLLRSLKTNPPHHYMIVMDHQPWQTPTTPQLKIRDKFIQTLFNTLSTPYINLSDSLERIY